MLVPTAGLAGMVILLDLGEVKNSSDAPANLKGCVELVFTRRDSLLSLTMLLV